MAAPLIAGAARVAGKKALSRQAARRAGGRIERKGAGPSPRPSYRRERIIPRIQVEDARREEGAPDVMLLRIRAASAANIVFWSTIPLFVPQILFWLLGFGSLGLEQIEQTAELASRMPTSTAIPGLSTIISLLEGMAGGLLPGKELFIFFYVLTAAVGLGSMLFAAAIFIFRGIPCFGKWKTVIFLGCLTGYLTIFLNFFPFVLIYAGAVVYLQGKDE